MVKKGFFIILLSILLIFSIIILSCKESPKEAVSMRIGWWGNPTRDKRTLAVIDLYQKTFPNVTIEPEYIGWGGYWDKINTQVAAGNLPDVMQHDYAYLLQFVSRNLMLDLTPFVQANTLDLRTVDETLLSGGRVNTKLYGISLGINCVCLAYNPKILKEAGVAEPTVAWIWADFEKMAVQIFQKTGVQTYPFFTTDPRVGFDNWIRQTDVSLFKKDRTGLGFSDPAELIKFFEIQLRLLDAGALVKPEVAFVTVSIEEGLFVQGKSWVDYMWSNQVNAYQAAMQEPITVMTLPKIANAKRPGTYLKPSMFFAVPKTTDKAEEAVKFINFFINDIGVNKILKAERGIPIVPVVRETLKNEVDATNQMIFDFIGMVADGNASPIDPPDPPNTGEVLKLFRDTTVEVLSGSISAADGANKIINRANEILAVNK